MFMNKKNEKGFTLIELMIVIAIIGILAAIAIPQFAAYRVRSYNASTQSQVRNIATALEAYFVDYTTYTIDPTVLEGDYGYTADPDVTITIAAGGTTSITDSYEITGEYPAQTGTRTYSLSGPGGQIGYTAP